ncbi:S9 family peptidase [bacterium]|nr:S9 family peptidase [bacterium]
MKSRLILVMLLLGLACMAGATERTHTIQPEDYFTQIFLSDVVVSPDGSQTAYVELRWDKEVDGRFNDIYILDNKSKEIRRLTFGAKNENHPRWTPDGEMIYFIGRYLQEGATQPPQDGTAQVWRIHADGSNLQAVTKVGDGIGSFELAADGSSIYYTVAREQMIDDFRELRSRYKNDLEFGHGIDEVTELHRLDLTTWRSEMIADPGRFISEFAVSGDQKYVAMLTTPNEHNVSAEGWSIVQVLDTATGDLTTLPDKQWREDAPSPYGWLGNLAWSEKGHKLAWNIDFDGYPAWVFATDLAGGLTDVAIRKLNRPDDVSVMGGIQWTPDGKSVTYLGDYHARTHIYSASFTSDETSNLTPGDVVVGGYDFAGSRGDLIAYQSTLIYYQDIVYYKKGRFDRLTHLNPQVDSWKLPQTSIYKWVGAEGDTVEGILELPPDYDGKTKLPLLLALHGGPTSAEPFCFQLWIYGRASFAAKGYAMLSPNYRGSTGYGDDFMTDLIGHENDRDVTDIMTGVDALIEDGIVDPERMAVSGWSNGGFLTNALISSNRFKAASSGAGVLDMTVQFLEEDTPGHVINFAEGLPWENPEEYQKASPLYSLKPGIKTAVLIHVGENDPRVPVTHSKGLHRVLYRYLDVPVELVIYPGAGHNLTKYTHRLAKVQWDHAWMDRYVLGK